MTAPASQDGPDLARGVTSADFKGRDLLRGHCEGEAVLLARVGDEVMAIGADCTHYGGPLDEGLVVGDTVRCPWHHACFSLRTGEALGAPAFDRVSRWRVEREGDRFIVRGRATEGPRPRPAATAGEPARDVLIIGGGAAGFACAEMLRRRGYEGSLTMLSGDDRAPYDRPPLSKGFLKGAVKADELPLRPLDFYKDAAIDLRPNTTVRAIDIPARRVDADGDSFSFDRLVLAMGAEPVRPSIPGLDRGHVFTLRSASDGAALAGKAEGAGAAVILGSGFIGLEAAAALRARGVETSVVTRGDYPFEKVLGRELGAFIRRVHEERGVKFHAGTSIARIDEGAVTLENGDEIAADLVVIAIGVKPRVDLAKAAGLEVDDGVLVDECLRAGPPGVYAAGDIARWRDAERDRRLRVEHWVVAERHGQHVARNILDGDRPFTDPPFFWTAHYDLNIRYVGHADDWDEVRIDGDLAARDFFIRYIKGGETLAIAAAGRDFEALEWEASREGRRAAADRRT